MRFVIARALPPQFGSVTHTKRLYKKTGFPSSCDLDLSPNFLTLINLWNCFSQRSFALCVHWITNFIKKYKTCQVWMWLSLGWEDQGSLASRNSKPSPRVCFQSPTKSVYGTHLLSATNPPQGSFYLVQKNFHHILRLEPPFHCCGGNVTDSSRSQLVSE